MTGSVRQINAGWTATEPAGACHVLHGEVERGSDGQVAQEDENMDEDSEEESAEGSNYGTSRSSSTGFCRN